MIMFLKMLPLCILDDYVPLNLSGIVPSGLYHVDEGTAIEKSMRSTSHWTWQVFGPHTTSNFSAAAKSTVLVELTHYLKILVFRFTPNR
ncbi:hypothetical protein Hdeb2414_s0009g00323541 [Helianthus debilis subsp. tardiflorus]